MAKHTGQKYKIIFPEWYDERAEFETPSKGHLDDVIVVFDTGEQFKLSFADEYNILTGWTTLGAPGLVVLEEVSTSKIQDAVPRLIQEGFFDTLRPEYSDDSESG